jgi:hypothetical protein
MSSTLVSSRISWSSQQQAQPESEQDPLSECVTPLVPPLFATLQTPLHRPLAEAVAKLDAFIQHPTAETAELAQEGASTLCSLMKRRDLRPSPGGRECFRRDFASVSLESICALPTTEEYLFAFERLLLDRGEGAPRRLSDSVLAGISDLNEAYGARLRRAYSRDGGLCDGLAQGFAGVAAFAQEIRKEYRRKTCECFDGSEPAARIQKRLAPLVAKAQGAIALIPPDRALPAQFQERVESTLARLDDYHFPDAVLLILEGLDTALGNRLELSRSRRSARTANQQS